MKRRRQTPWADHYTRKARESAYPARSVFKLKEIQQKFRLIRRGQRVLDLGCAPGSWLLYAAALVGPEGCVIGVDRQPLAIRLPPQAKALEADIFLLDDAFFDSIGCVFNVILSDLAPATTGQKSVDAARSFELCKAALAVARSRLHPGGGFVCKIFTGENFKTFCDRVGNEFRRLQIFKPRSSRKASRETYLIGIEKR